MRNHGGIQVLQPASRLHIFQPSTLRLSKTNDVPPKEVLVLSKRNMLTTISSIRTVDIPYENKKLKYLSCAQFSGYFSWAHFSGYFVPLWLDLIGARNIVLRLYRAVCLNCPLAQLAEVTKGFILYCQVQK